MTFSRDGTYHLELDMNSCSGGFETVEDDSIRIQQPGCTKICCDSQFSVRFTEMLSKVKTYSIDDSILKLYIPGWGYVELQRKD